MTERQKRVLAALLTSPSKAAAAEAAGVTVRTVQNYLSDPAFREEYQSALEDVVMDAAKQAKQSLSPALSTLREITEDRGEDAQARIGAARAILTSGLKLIETADILTRLGINTDEFNNQLSQVPGTADKLHFALDTLQNEGLAGVYNAWVENNEALVKNKDASFEFKESLAELGEEMQPLMTTVTELAGSFLDWFNDLSDGQQGAIVALIGIVAAISPVASAISSVSGAVGAVTKNLDAVKTAASGVFSLFTSNPMLLAIGAISAALLLLILNWDKVKETVENVIDAVIGFIEKGIDAVKRFFSALSNGKDKTGGPSKSPSPVSPRSPRPRARMAAFADNETDGNNGEGASITAGTFSRAATVRALESAIPNVEARMALATANMAPAAGYSAPPMAHSGGGADHRQPVQQPTQQTITINFTGDLAQLGRVLKPVIDIENRRIGPGV
ncbi:hypothetical protein [uncultured Oscillibacter sp.]|uniref:hypothetical protein n=1 Tax=uncultured Oscillibacter sp. TaxID=876091 RepID=UPI00261EDA57|nr:hypothetical protein [uncultured Oscillibacter sp.]